MSEYKDGELLRKVRAEISKLGASEAQASEMFALQELFDQIQTLREEMNEAKKSAAAEAAKPYLEVIEKVEKRYAMTLKLVS